MSFYGPTRPDIPHTEITDQVEVVRGRKVPIGTVGEVFWQKLYCYGQGEWAKQDWRIGIRAKDDTVHFTSENNVKVIARVNLLGVLLPVQE